MGRLIAAMLATPTVCSSPPWTSTGATRCAGTLRPLRPGHGVTVGTEFDAAARSPMSGSISRGPRHAPHLAACVRHGAGAVVGTTGFSDEQTAAIADTRGRSHRFAPT